MIQNDEVAPDEMDIGNGSPEKAEPQRSLGTPNYLAEILSPTQSPSRLTRKKPDPKCQSSPVRVPIYGRKLDLNF